VENSDLFCLAERRRNGWNNGSFHDQGQDTRFSTYPLRRRSRCRVRASSSAGPRQVAGRLCLCLPGSCRRDSAPLIRIFPPFHLHFLSYSLQQRTGTIQRSCPWHVAVAGFSVSSWERGKQGATKCSAADGVGQPLNFVSFFLGLCKQPTFVLKDAEFSIGIWDRVASYSNGQRYVQMIALAHCRFVRASPWN
jgi:hypothetical protein